VADSPNRYPKTAVAIAFLGVAIVFATMVLPFHYSISDRAIYVDEGDHAATGRLILHGGSMYRDAFNEKGPGLYWLTALLFGLFGDSFAVLRNAATVGVLATLILLFFAGSRNGKPSTGLLAAATFGAFHCLYQGYLWQSETLLTPMLLALFLLLQSDNRRPLLMGTLAGVCLFVGTLTKQTTWIAVAVLIGVLLLRKREETFAKSLMGLTGGLLAPWALVLVFVTIGGNLEPFISGYLFPLTHFGIGSYAYLPGIGEQPFQLPIWWMVAVAAIGITGRSKTLFRGLLAISILMMLPALFPYHYPPVLAMASLGFAIAISERPAGKMLKAVALGGLIAVTVFAFMKTPVEDILNTVDSEKRVQMGSVATHVARNTDPSDRLWVYPHNSAYYYLTGLQAPGRYGFALPWTLPHEAVIETLTDLGRTPPEYILDTLHETCPTNGVAPKDYMAPILDWIGDRYRLDQLFPNGAIAFRLGEPSDYQRCINRRILLVESADCDQDAAELVADARTACADS
jgi:Dolichyl-phosphate-mannose-protein mannosyltransferase